MYSLYGKRGRGGSPLSPFNNFSGGDIPPPPLYFGDGICQTWIKIEIKEPRDFNDIKLFIAYPMAYIEKSTIGDLPEWTKMM
ncbi:MAG TPA: hypothetical protein PKM50_04795 [Methanoregula sp.]|nr:hypothetical protein [Methanoregula sp.]